MIDDDPAVSSEGELIEIGTASGGPRFSRLIHLREIKFAVLPRSRLPAPT